MVRIEGFLVRWARSTLAEDLLAGSVFLRVTGSESRVLSLEANGELDELIAGPAGEFPGGIVDLVLMRNEVVIVQSFILIGR